MATELIEEERQNELIELTDALERDLSHFSAKTENISERNLVDFIRAGILKFKEKLFQKKFKECLANLNNITEFYLSEINQ